MTEEDLLIKHIEGGIRAIKGGRKTPDEASLGSRFTRLKTKNPGMYEDLLEKYITVEGQYRRGEIKQTVSANRPANR